MAPAPSASAFPLHPNSCLLDEHDRMLFQHSHPTGTDAERTTLQEGVEGFSAAISKAIQPQSHALHLDQRAGTLPTHHRSNERVPGSSSQATKAAEDQPKYYKELTVRCTSWGERATARCWNAKKVATIATNSSAPNPRADLRNRRAFLAWSSALASTTSNSFRTPSTIPN